MGLLCRLRVVVVGVVLVGLLGACSSHPRADAAAPKRDLSELATELDQTLRRGKTGNAFYVARVVDLKTGKELYAVDPDKPVMPASNGKIAVSAATLDFFGPKAKFKTYLALDGDDLWIVGTGDPGIGDSMLEKRKGRTTMSVLDDWVDALTKRGIKTIKGDLVYYDRAFDDQRIHPSWSRGYITEWYAAPISGLNFNNNCVDISVTPTATSQPVKYKIVPPTKDVRVVNKCVTGKGDEPDIDREDKTNTFTIKGATTKPVNIKSEAIIDPGAFFADALKTHLAEKGIAVAGSIRRAEHPLGGALIPPKKKIVAVHETSMVDAIGRINKQSQNNFAEGFCKMLGRGYSQKKGNDQPGSWENGSDAVKAFLQKNKIDTTDIRVVDGSGLSREDRVTSRMISQTFVTMWRHKYKETFFNSLTISGTDGTIEKRLLDLKGRVHAKTGFIGGVRSLSGYVQNDDGHWMAFSIIYNGFGGSAKPFEAMQDNAVRLLAAWPKHVELPSTREATSRPD